VDLGVSVEARVGEDDQPVVEVGGLPEGGQYHPAGGDAGQDERSRVQAAQHHIEVAAGERGHPALGHHQIPRAGRHGGVDLGRRAALDEPPGRRERREGPVPGADLGVAGTEADGHVHHRDGRGAGGGDRAGQPLQVAGIGGETLDDSPLDVHHQQHGRIHRPGALLPSPGQLPGQDNRMDPGPAAPYQLVGIGMPSL
jgi:hypothetical protein